DDDVEDLVEAAIGVLINRGVEERREGLHLRVGQLEARHAAVGPPRVEELGELLAVVVFLDERRSRQVGPARSAAGVRAVTETALIDQQRLATLDRLRIGWRRQRLLLGRDMDGQRQARQRAREFFHAHTLPQNRDLA